MKAKVSVCFIVRDDEGTGLLEECFQSIRPYVEEIVVVDTGSTDGTPEIAKKYADVFEVFTDCNDPVTGEIADFSKARNRSFDLATKPWVMWMDSDDILAGGEHLARLIEFGEHNRKNQPDGHERDWCFLFPYEYVYSPSGQCICLHYRERLVSRRGAMTWVNPVHEVMLPSDRANLYLQPCDDVVFKHQRQRSKKPGVPGRNLRILQKLVEVDGCEDARQFYYLGLEYANAGQHEKATQWLTRYFGVSGWEDEKTMAAMKLADIAFSQGRHQEGIVWAFRAVETKENWGEGYFALARGFYNLALAGAPGGDVKRNWEKCAHFARTGLALPPTKTMLFVNPLERAVDAHVFLTTAYSQLGDVRSALRHAEEAKKAVPNDPNLLYNMRTFERAVAADDARAALDRIVAVEGISPETRDQIYTILRGGDQTVAANWLGYERPASYPRGVEERHFPVARKTPHERSFALPESSNIDDLPLVMTEAQLEAATIMLWKEYILHDEILAAERLLADAPYRVKHSPTIDAALSRTRRMTAWMDDSKKEQSYNGPEDPTIEQGVPLPDPLLGQLLDRSNLGLRTLRKGEKVLDLGCSDGSILNRWALEGHDVTGADLCENSIAMARRKAEEFKTGAKFVVSKFSDLNLPECFDVVTTTDTYEHVRDHVKDMIAPARRALTPNGRMIVVTPHGSWMRGKYVKWAHPWRWADDLGKPWNCDEPHAHLVAPTPWTVADNFRKDGWWVKDSFVVDSASHQDVEGQGNVYCEARLIAPACADGAEPLDIVFACGDAWQAWNPEIMRREGIGGSETMVVHMAKRLAGLGHRVRVYTSTGKYGDGIFDGVEYRQTAHLQNVESCDVLVAWRNAALLSTPIKAKERLLWVHDIFAGNATHRHLLKADRVLALSEWHRRFVMNHHNLPGEQVLKTRNGIDFTRFAHDVPRNTKKVVYSSSPDRALPVLLKVWPQIRARVPDAELHVFYGFFNWKKAAEARGSQDELMGIDFLERQMVDLASSGVHNRGKVDQDTLAKEFLSAGVLASPTWFSETSCISAMEAQAAGLRIVTSSIAALNETVGPEFGVLIDGDWLSDEYQTRFVEETVRALTAPEGEWLKTREEIRARAFQDFDLDELAEDWVRMMRDGIEHLKVRPIVPYQPRADFKREAA
jgi:2-polyprenyl-3-methyl-5-hydroxy-6-metoxy-1,4-benzoquinol methylase/glycosyltransferase involved in cell wall biosynthesis